MKTSTIKNRVSYYFRFHTSFSDHRAHHIRPLYSHAEEFCLGTRLLYAASQGNDLHFKVVSSDFEITCQI